MKEEIKKEKHAGGRPTIYSEELSNTIFTRLAEGESLEQICKDDAMPALNTVYEWRKRHKEFSEGYSRARKRYATTLVEKTKGMVDELEMLATNCPATVNDATLLRARAEVVKLRSTVYQYLAGKFNNKYADKSSSRIKQETKVEVVTSDEARNKLADALNKKINPENK